MRAAADVHPRCHVCHHDDVRELDGFAALHRVTSDCKPWPSGGRLGVCGTCGCVQKALDERWAEEAKQIYADYTIYHQSGGCEQALFQEESGRPAARSAQLAKHLQSALSLPESGRLLDVGCGNGALLRAFADVKPGWRLVGAELDGRYQATVESIPGVESFYSVPPVRIPGVFTAISLMHVIEHIVDPVAFLATLRPKLEDGGVVIVEVPDCAANPFDLVVADHASHFTAATLRDVVERAGYEILVVASDWIPKELSLVARPARRPPQVQANPAVETSIDIATRHVDWLRALKSAAQGIADRVPLVGVFGTSIAGTWLFAELPERIGFFVDEDRNRVGRAFMDRPVFHPSELVPSTHVLVPLPPTLAEDLSARLRKAHAGVTWHIPQSDECAHDTCSAEEP